MNIIANFEALSENDFTKFAGEWIAVINGKVIAHSKDFKQVCKESREKFPQEKPLIGKVPEAMPLVLSVH